MQQTIPEKKSNFFVIPPEIQPRRQDTVENIFEKKEAIRYRLPGLLISIEEENVNAENEEVLRAGLEEGQTREQNPHRSQSCIEEFPIVEC